ncbi:MAG: B12-binding domain-containing radical SAM protein [Pseudomonadota bacterium]
MEIGASIATGGPVARPAPPKVLMIQPRFMGGSFWAFEDTSKIYGAEYPMPPLGLVTVAGMLPADWDVTLKDRNVEAVTEEDLLAADLIMTGGMLPQRGDLLHLIAWAQSLGKKVVAGGPDVMSSTHVYNHVDFLVVGEAEGVIDQFISAWQEGVEGHHFYAERHKADVTKSPVPRFDLIDRSKYPQMTVQFSRGCPFTCEFCDIIELFGRRPRTKTHAQIFKELQTIYDLGYRGHINFVDDNLIGNKKAVKQFLPELVAWQEAHDWPFDFATEASLNLADDAELMSLMSKAGFIGVFIGIESPDPDVLNATKKKQNTKRDIAQSVHRVYANGIGVMAGFIVGFDEEKGSVGDGIAELIEEAAIPVAMIGLLYALPETELTRRLKREGRLHELNEDEIDLSGSADQCTQGLNFETLRPREDILQDFRTVVARAYDVKKYHERVRRMADLMAFPDAKVDVFRSGFLKNMLPFVRLSIHMGVKAKNGKRAYWWTIIRTLLRNPTAVEVVALSLAAYTHTGPFSRQVLTAIDNKIQEARDQRFNPVLVEAAE